MYSGINIRLALFLCLLCCAACEKNEDLVRLTSGDYFIFGTTYGECLGNCVQLFKIEDGQLFADKDLDYISAQTSDLSFQDRPLPESSYQLALPLIEAFPSELWQEKESVLGMPDAYDQGSILIERTTGSGARRWILDTDPRNLPKYLHSYTEKVLQVTRMLQ